MSSPTCRDMSATIPANAEHDLGRMFEFSEEWCDMGRPKIMNDDEVDLLQSQFAEILVKKHVRM